MNTLLISLKKFTTLLFTLVCINFSLSENASSASLDIPIELDSSSGQWRLTSDYLSTIDNGAIIEATGNVVLERGNDVLKADFARYYVETDWVFIRDEVFVRLGRDELIANEAEFNLETSTGFLKDGSVFMAGPHVYFEGEHVTKYFGDRYSFNNAYITSCDPENPAWGIKASSATVEIDGYATLKSANMEVASTDLPTIPYLILPAKKTRQTGLLKPDFGLSSLHGIYYTQPWFWAIDEESDMTLYGSYFNNSGVMLSAEYRSHTRQYSKNWLSFDYLVSTDGTSNRFWLRGMSNGNFGESGWKYKYNIDYVSDNTYLEDYENTLTGYDNSVEESYKYFGRSLSKIDDNRITGGYIYKDWKNITLTAGFEYTQNPVFGDTLLSSDDPTVQKLPEVNLFVSPLSSANIPLQFDGTAQVLYNHREFGSSGMKTEVAPRLSVPLNFGFVSTLSQVEVSHRNYFANRSSATTAPLEPTTENNANSALTQVKANFEMGMQTSRIWNLDENSLSPTIENIGKSETLAVRHLFEPRISYAYIQDKDQSALPYYTQNDRIYAMNEVNFSLRNVFTRKTERVMSSKEGDEAIPFLSTSFDNIARFVLSGGYDFEEAQRENFKNIYERRPFKDLTLDSNVNVYGFGLQSQISYSLYGDGVTRFDIGTHIPLFDLSKYISWSTAYSYRDEMYDYQNILRHATSENIALYSNESLWRNTFTIKPNSTFEFNIDHYLDLEEKETYEVEFSASYIDQCYIITAKYKYTQNEQTYGLNIVLPGIFD